MTESTEQNLSALYQYCSSNGIFVHPSIQPKEVAGAGLGVYTTRNIKAGEKLVQVPTKHIFTVDSIPETFLPISVRKDLAVHAQLATFFAFGDEESLRQFQPWIATWPSFNDFTDTMPLFWGFWGAYVMQELGLPSNTSKASTNTHQPVAKKRKVDLDAWIKPRNRRSTGSYVYQYQKPCLSLSPALSGTYTICPADHPARSGLMLSMVTKLVSHVKSIANILPNFHLLEDEAQLVRFFHAWCLVNTRCFYYFPSTASPSSKRPKPKAKPPSDPNEAMALCPFMDLFNHKAPPPSSDMLTSAAEIDNNITQCKVRCTSTGFVIITMSSLPANTEVLLSYGPHTNDTLWSEYGFLLPDATNNCDSISLDEIILPHLKSADLSTLEEHSYLNEYTLQNEGSICYRTEMVAWLLILGRHKWTKVVEQGLDPEESCTSPTGKHDWIATIEKWLSEITEQSDLQISALEQMTNETLLDCFRTMSVVDTVRPPQSEEESLVLAKRRRDMCLARWRQIWSMADRGIDLIRDDHEGG